MVERDHAVVEADGKVGDVELIEARSRQTLDVMTKGIAEEPGRTALKRGQVGNRRRLPAAQLHTKGGEGVGVGGFDAVEPDTPAARLQPGKRIGHHERIASQRRSGGRAVEK